MKRSALAALTAIGLVFAMGLVAPELRAQTFPSEPITLIVAWPAGGGSDISMRLLADGLAAAGDILAFAGWSPDHAVRRVPWRPVRRLDHRDPGQDPG